MNALLQFQMLQAEQQKQMMILMQQQNQEMMQAHQEQSKEIIKAQQSQNKEMMLTQQTQNESKMNQMMEMITIQKKTETKVKCPRWDKDENVKTFYAD